MDRQLWFPIADGEYLGLEPSKRLPLYTRGNAGEVFPEVQYPLSFTTSFDIAQSSFRNALTKTGGILAADIDNDQAAFVGCFGGYTYLNVSLMRVLTARAPGAKISDLDRNLYGTSDAPAYVPERWHKNLGGTFGIIRYAVRTARARSLPQQEADVARVAAWKRTLPDYSSASDAELVEILRGSLPMLADLFANHLYVSGQNTVPIGQLTKLCEKVGDPTLLPRLLGGAGSVASAEPSTDLWRLGRMVAADAALTAHFDAGTADLDRRLRDAGAPTRAFVEAFDAFLAEHGSRGRNEWETACPTWGTDPDLALALVDRLRGADADHDPAVGQQRLRQTRAAALAEADAKLGRGARRRLRRALASCDLYAQGRERAKTTVVKAIHEGRLISRELGRRVAARTGGQPDDLWFVTNDEMDEFLASPHEFTERIAERRRMRDLISQYEPPFTIDGVMPPFDTWVKRTDIVATSVRVGDVLTGIAGCSGVARGRARIVRHPGEPGDLGPGHVLIAPYTDPAWTPLFLAPDAVVVDVGAVMSHAVIVSRELGIPSAVSVTDATRRIPHDALIEVDGTNGTVTILEL